MSYEEVDSVNRADFAGYCRKHRYDHDESWLSDHDLDTFDPSSEEDRALIFRDEAGLVRGAAALMLRPELLAEDKARFRIFHVESELGDELVAKVYREFLDRLAPHAGSADWLYLFLPESAARPTAIIQDLGFSIERYAWLLERDLGELPYAELPPGFAFRAAIIRELDGRAGPDAIAWCQIVNLSFLHLAGHTELTPSRLVSEIDPNLDFEGSWLLLEDRGQPIGLVASVRDLEVVEARGGFLGPIAILPDYQGRGLGRAALRAGLAAARRAGCLHCCLSVNAENANALRLYLGEGFRKKSVMVCWHRHPSLSTGAPAWGL